MISFSHWPQWMRGLSLLLAGVSSGFVLIYPHFFGRVLSTIDHAFLPLFLLAVAASFTFGLGFRFESQFLRILVSPIIVWPILGATLFFMRIY